MRRARLSLSAIAVLAACAPESAPGERAPDTAAVEPPTENVVVVTIDTLRADRLGCYGHPGGLTPNLDAFARGAIRCTSAFSTSSFTPPSHASLLTSQYVSRHGLRTWNRLPDDRLTLAEIFRDLGYDTAAFVHLGLLTKQGLGQGFETGSDDPRNDGEVIAAARAFLERAGPRPFFLWVHLYSVHRPYGGTSAWRDHIGMRSLSGIGEGEAHYNLEPHEVAEQGLSRTQLEYIAALYDAGVALADTTLAPLLADLSTPSHLEDTLVVITSDHGENLLEHDEMLFSHDPFLYP